MFPEGVRSICLAAFSRRKAARLTMKEKLEIVRGSRNVFRDLGHQNADVEQFKAILAGEIIKALDQEKLSVRGAQSRTGIAAADFSRIRNADLGRFTVDRLISIINRLGSRVEVKVRVRRAASFERRPLETKQLKHRAAI
jgi:predicted XRE-type DNA-binding protein